MCGSRATLGFLVLRQAKHEETEFGWNQYFILTLSLSKGEDEIGLSEPE